MMSTFWWRWLVVVTIGVAAFGAGMILLLDTIHSLFEVIVNMSVEDSRYLYFVNGVLGAVMIGWMVTFLYILYTGFRRGAREAWNTLVLSLVAWFVIDSGFSIVSGFAGNAVFNTAFLILFAVPLAATYRRFYADVK